MTGDTKICTKCGEEKELSKFWKCNQYKDGYHQYCKSCMKEYEKKRKLKNKTFIFDYDSLTIISKVCTKCNLDKPLNEYIKDKNKADGYKNACITCTNIYRQKYRDTTPEQVKKANERAAKWYQDDNNKIKQKTTNKIWAGNNKEKIDENNAKYQIKNKDRIRKSRKEYYIKNKKTIRIKKNKWERDKRKFDNLFKLKVNLRSLIRGTIKRNGYIKKSKTSEILGCSFEGFKAYLESKFEPWMNWDNYGRYNGTPNYGWDLDHIIPISSAKTEEDIIKLNHYTNFQPLCSYINRVVKRNKVLDSVLI